MNGTLHNDTTATQCAAILGHLQSGKAITPLEALNLYGCFRLGARIWDLRQKGYPIQTIHKPFTKPNGRRTSVAEYRLNATAQ